MLVSGVAASMNTTSTRKQTAGHDGGQSTIAREQSKTRPAYNQHNMATHTENLAGIRMTYIFLLGHIRTCFNGTMVHMTISIKHARGPKLSWISPGTNKISSQDNYLSSYRVWHVAPVSGSQTSQFHHTLTHTD